MHVDRERLATWGKGFLIFILIAQLLGLLIIFRGEGQDTEPDQTAQAPPTQSEPSTPEGSPTRDESDSDDSTVAQEDTSGASFNGTAEVSRQGGYRFRYPRDWQVQQAGTATEITSSDAKAKVTLGLAPPGDLRSASQKTVTAIQSEYGDVIVTELWSESIRGRPARVVQGKATNAENVRLFFRSVTVRGEGEIFAIVAFEAAEPEEEMRPAIEKIIGTFKQVRNDSRSVSAAPTHSPAETLVSA